MIGPIDYYTICRAGMCRVKSWEKWCDKVCLNQVELVTRAERVTSYCTWRLQHKINTKVTCESGWSARGVWAERVQVKISPG